MQGTLNKNESNIPEWLITSGLVLLMLGFLFGLIGAAQYAVPGFLKGIISFQKIRPLHVSAVVFWIIVTAMGSVLIYQKRHFGKPFMRPVLELFFPVLIITVGTVLVSYFFGIFGGREYWEFHPALAVPLLFCWILYLFLFLNASGSFKNQPVYVWMWLTGIIFFLFTFLESYLWIFPYFRDDIVNDMTIQWKSYGSMVGSWNMLIYGCSIYLMDKISDTSDYGHSRIAFALYFTGLFNLMFNWGHHIYTLPTHGYVKYISYAVSMTELVIIGRIIWLWRSSVSTARKYFYATSYRFLLAADVWIFLTLLLAIAMSVPAINLYTHGTHITVAHSMGATIGINTMLLLAIVYDIMMGARSANSSATKWIHRGYWIANIALFWFWLSLITAGVLKAKWQMAETRAPFGEMMTGMQSVFAAFLITGGLVATGLMMIVLPLLWMRFQKLKI